MMEQRLTPEEAKKWANLYAVSRMGKKQREQILKEVAEKCQNSRK